MTLAPVRLFVIRDFHYASPSNPAYEGVKDSLIEAFIDHESNEYAFWHDHAPFALPCELSTTSEGMPCLWHLEDNEEVLRSRQSLFLVGVNKTDNFCQVHLVAGATIIVKRLPEAYCWKSSDIHYHIPAPLDFDQWELLT